MNATDIVGYTFRADNYCPDVLTLAQVTLPGAILRVEGPLPEAAFTDATGQLDYDAERNPRDRAAAGLSYARSQTDYAWNNLLRCSPYAPDQVSRDVWLAVAFYREARWAE